MATSGRGLVRCGQVLLIGRPVHLKENVHVLSRWCPHLQVPALELVHGDVLDIRNMPELLASFSKRVSEQGPKVKVVANIPYNITSSALLTTQSGYALSFHMQHALRCVLMQVF